MSSTEPAARARPAAPRKRRTQAERSDEMQTRLVEAAATVLRRKGYAGLRTDEVARVAKVSRGALQHHFPSKDSLVVATAQYLLEASLVRGQQRAATIAAARDPIAAIIADGVEFFLGPDFGVVLDLVLAGSKDRSLRDQPVVAVDDVGPHLLRGGGAGLEQLLDCASLEAAELQRALGNPFDPVLPRPGSR